MNETALSLAYKDLRSSVGFALGYGRDPDKWTERQTDDIDFALRAGQNDFYNCGYDWSFLKPIITLPVTQGSNSLSLPEDYAAMDSHIAVAKGDGGAVCLALEVGPWQFVYDRETKMPDTTGAPMVVCERILPGTTQQRGQRMELRFWPKADSDYTMTFMYRLNPDALSGHLPYAYGGAQHSRTLLEACLAAAERLIDNVPMGPMAVHQMAYMKMLEESKQLDRRAKPHTVGMMRDRSDAIRRHIPGAVRRSFVPVMVQGQIWD